LLHSSGISNYAAPLIQRWRDVVGDSEGPNRLVYESSMPLIFEPGEGWSYGGSIRAAQLLLERLTSMNTEEYTQANVFKPLGMNLTTYGPAGHPEVFSRALNKVSRDAEGKLNVVDEPMYGLTTCASDFHILMADLMSSSSKILSTKECIDLVFEPQFPPGSAALKALRGLTEDYEYPAGIPRDAIDPPVNYSVGGLVVEDQLPLSSFPKGTVTWNGYPNVVWAMNQDKGLGMLFATQLVPVDDPKTVDIMMDFFQAAWAYFG